jgi:hypothetical protein
MARFYTSTPGGRGGSIQATTQNRPEEYGKDKKGNEYFFIHSDHRTIKVYAQPP